MKKSFKSIVLGGAFLFGLSMFLTSCEDVLGKWEKPVPQVPTEVVEEAKVLGAALDEGAEVVVTYTVGNKQYKATFTKGAGDTYTLVKNEEISPATARAMTRTANPFSIVPTGDDANGNIDLKLVGGNLVLTVKTAAGLPIFEAQMNVTSGEITVVNTNAGGVDCKIGSFSAKGEEIKDIKNPEMLSVIIVLKGNQYPIKYKENETWADVIERYKTLGEGLVEIAATEENYITVKFSKPLIMNQLKGLYPNATEEELERAYFNESLLLPFYLVKNLPPTARAFTRWAYSPDDFVKSTDTVGTQATYYLTDDAPQN